MDKRRKIYLPLFFIFIAINTLCLVFKTRLQPLGINTDVLLTANIILFLLSLVSIFMHLKALKNVNPHAFVRSVMGATLLKLFVIAGSAFVYLYAAGEGRSVKAVLAAMAIYFLYTIIEVRSVFSLNKQKNGSF
jgi:hypothetical protein